MLDWSKRHPRLSAIVGIIMSVVAGLATLQGIWNLFSNEPLFTYISANIPLWPRILLFVLFCTIATLGIVLVVGIFRRTNKSTQKAVPSITSQSKSNDAALPSRREALESSKVAWGLWHTGTRMRIEKLLKLESLKRILILEPNKDTDSIEIIAKRSEESTESIITQIQDTTREALENGKDIRWYSKHRESAFTIYDATPVKDEDGTLKPCSDNAWMYVEYLNPEVGVDQRTGEVIYNKGKNKSRFMGFYHEYKDIWENKSVKANTISDKTKTETPKTIIKDSKFQAEVKRADKASAVEVNIPAELSNVEATLKAEDVKDAAAFRTNQGLTSHLVLCSCGKAFSYVHTGGPTKTTIKCPNCGREYPTR